MALQSNRLYSISEVSKMVKVHDYVLRQWESRYPQLNPKRNRANHRVYSEEDILVVQRIKELTQYDGHTTKGTRIKLTQELYAHSTPQTKREALDLIDEIQQDVRSALELLDGDTE